MSSNHQAPPTILQRIVTDKRAWVAAAASRRPMAALQDEARDQPATRDFVQALSNRVMQQQPGVIAEIKKASPSKGVIRPDFDVPAVARSYAEHGAACLSILTDVPYFQGDDAYLAAARAVMDLPILRKDFVIDPYQVYESRVLGADCILLIASILAFSEMQTLEGIAHELGMSVLVEVHDASELETVLPLASPLLGINNRNLHTFDVSLDTSLSLAARVRASEYGATKHVVTESGIHTAQDVLRMSEAGIMRFLVGESFMRAPDPGAQLSSVFARQS
ncbi:MAG: indole-3-glycerol phosphate synthase TrpC [Gammaproteobacteria bacterium]